MLLKLFHKSSPKITEATAKLLGNTIAEKILKPKPVTDENSTNVEEIIILPLKRQEILHELRRVL